MPSSQKEDVPTRKWKPSAACASPFSCDVQLRAGGAGRSSRVHGGQVGGKSQESPGKRENSRDAQRLCQLAGAGHYHSSLWTV